jgi:ribosome assembly protein 4
VPFSFHVSLPADATSPGALTRIVISKSIEADVLSHPTQAFTEEDVFVVHCSPQSVFRVRPATRCSSTLSGEFYITPSHCIGVKVLCSGHTSPILCASFSPTGNMMATGSGDTNARLWDLFTETPSHVLSGHKGWVLCVEWEAMERKLATGGHDGHVGPIFSSVFRHRFTRYVFRSDYGIQRLASPSGTPSKATRNG